MKKLFSTLFVLTLSLLAVASSAQAATITVTSGSTDELTTNSSCSVREAIINANNNAATYADCTAGSGDDEIFIPAGTYSLSLVMIDEDADGLINEENDDTEATGDLDIKNNLTITGEGASTTTIDGTYLLDCTNDVNDRVMQVYSGYTVTLSEIEIEHGGSQSTSASCTKSGASFDYGGGIYNSGTLTLTNVVVDNNESEEGGGGIYNNGTLTITGGSVLGNESESGAGIYVAHAIWTAIVLWQKNFILSCLSWDFWLFSP